MLTTLVTRLENSTPYSLISRRSHLRPRPDHAAVWLRSPAEQGAQHFPNLHTRVCQPASRAWLCVPLLAVGSLFLIWATATCAIT